MQKQMIPGELFTDRGLVDGSSYQQPRRGRGRKKQRKLVFTRLFSVAEGGVVFVNVSSAFKEFQ